MNKIWLKFLPVFTFVQIDVRRLFRDRSAMFFTFLFPIIFLGIFGSIFGARDRINFKIALINQSESIIAGVLEKNIRNEKLFEFPETELSLDEAKEAMRRNEINGIVILPQEFGTYKKGEKYPEGDAQLLYDQSDLQSGLALTFIFDGVFKQMNQRFSSGGSPFILNSSKVADSGLSEFDYIFAGVLGFTILTLATTTPSTVFPRHKQGGVLRRYHTTPLTVWQYFMSNILSHIVIGLLATATMIVFAITVFDLKVVGSYVNLAVFISISCFTLFGLGMAIGGWAKNENQAGPLSNLITFPMMFLAGTFFPRFLMSDWLQKVSEYLPLTPVIDGTRYIVTEGKTLPQVMPEIIMLGVWAIIIYAFAFHVFRWE